MKLLFPILVAVLPSLDSQDSKSITLDGTLVWNTLEGGFWGLKGTDGKNYDLHGNKKLFEGFKSGDKAVVKGKLPKDAGCFHMWGTIVDVESIEHASKTKPEEKDFKKLVEGLQAKDVKVRKQAEDEIRKTILERIVKKDHDHGIDLKDGVKKTEQKLDAKETSLTKCPKDSTELLSLVLKDTRDKYADAGYSLKAFICPKEKAYWCVLAQTTIIGAQNYRYGPFEFVDEIPEPVRKHCEKHRLTELDEIKNDIFQKYCPGYRIFAVRSQYGMPCQTHFASMAYGCDDKTVEVIDSKWLIKHLKTVKDEEDMKRLAWVAFNLTADHSAFKHGRLDESKAGELGLNKNGDNTEVVSHKNVIAAFDKEGKLINIKEQRCMAICTCGCDRSDEMIAELGKLYAKEALVLIEKALAEIAKWESYGKITDKMNEHRNRLIQLATELK